MPQKYSYRKVKTKARNCFVEIDVGTLVKIIVATPSDDSNNNFVVIFRDQKTNEDLSVIVVQEKLLKK